MFDDDTLNGSRPRKPLEKVRRVVAQVSRSLLLPFPLIAVLHATHCADPLANHAPPSRQRSRPTCTTAMMIWNMTTRCTRRGRGRAAPYHDRESVSVGHQPDGGRCLGIWCDGSGSGRRTGSCGQHHVDSSSACSTARAIPIRVIRRMRSPPCYLDVVYF